MLATAHVKPCCLSQKKRKALLKLSFLFHPPRPDLDGNGYICASELGDLFREVGCPLPGYQIRELLQRLDRDKDSRINLEEFTAVGNINLSTNKLTLRTSPFTD